MKIKIKWCPEIFKKTEKAKCYMCYVLNRFNSERYCYGILYIFHKIAQIRFFFIGLFRAIKRLIEKIKDDNKLIHCLECGCLIKNKLKKCPYCGHIKRDIPF